MLFRKTSIVGTRLIDLDKKSDPRGFFARMLCRSEMGKQRLDLNIVQINTSYSVQAGTLRGMHYQLAPAAETKIIRCISGALFDVVLDLRPDSPSFGQWFGVELSMKNRTTLYIPKGCAHGFYTLKENTEVLYMVDCAYEPELERGVRYNDPSFGIVWPAMPEVMSEKDQNWPDFDPEWHGVERLKGLLALSVER